MIALGGLALALMVGVPARSHADDLIGTGVAGVAVQIGPPQNIQVIAGDQQTGVAIANASTGVITAELYNDTWVLLTPDLQHTIATLSQADPTNTNIFAGTVQIGALAGAQITVEYLGLLDDIHAEDLIDVQWNGVQVQWYAIGTTISYHQPI
jgi:hypothetical protein